MLARIFFALFAAVTIPVGLWFAYQGAQSAVEAAQSPSWPKAAGQITGSHVQTSVSHGRHGGTSYTPVISYTYLVAGTTYTGTVIAPGRTWGSKSAYAAVSAHPFGASAQVSYDPAHPATAVLETGLRSSSFGQFLLGSVVATFGTIFALAGTNFVPSGQGGTSNVRRDTIGGRLVLPFVGLLVAEIVALIWLS